MLYTVGGEPIAPASANAFLKTVDPHFFLKWVNGAISYWAIMKRWEERDPRRERIQRGELDPMQDADVFHFLPQDCSAENVEGYVLRHFVRSVDKNEEVEKAVAATEKRNADVKAKAVENVKTEVFEQAIRRTKHDNELAVGATTANAQVTVGVDLKPKRGK